MNDALEEKLAAAVMVAGKAERRTWEMMACLYMARQARLEATEQNNDAETRIAFQERERCWLDRAYRYLAEIEAEAKGSDALGVTVKSQGFIGALELLGYDLDQRDRDPNAPLPPLPTGGAAA